MAIPVPTAPLVIPSAFNTKRGNDNVDSASPSTQSSWSDAIAYVVKNQCDVDSLIKFSASVTINEFVDCQLTQAGSLSIKGAVPVGEDGTGVDAMYQKVKASIVAAVAAA